MIGGSGQSMVRERGLVDLVVALPSGLRIPLEPTGTVSLIVVGRLNGRIGALAAYAHSPCRIPVHHWYGNRGTGGQRRCRPSRESSSPRRSGTTVVVRSRHISHLIRLRQSYSPVTAS